MNEKINSNLFPLIKKYLKSMLCSNNSFKIVGKYGTGTDAHPQVLKCTKCSCYSPTQLERKVIVKLYENYDKEGKDLTYHENKLKKALKVSLVGLIRLN